MGLPRRSGSARSGRQCLPLRVNRRRSAFEPVFGRSLEQGHGRTPPAEQGGSGRRWRQSVALPIGDDDDEV